MNLIERYFVFAKTLNGVKRWPMLDDAETRLAADYTARLRSIASEQLELTPGKPLAALERMAEIFAKKVTLFAREEDLSPEGADAILDLLGRLLGGEQPEQRRCREAAAAESERDRQVVARVNSRKLEHDAVHARHYEAIESARDANPDRDLLDLLREARAAVATTPAAQARVDRAHAILASVIGARFASCSPTQHVRTIAVEFIRSAAGIGALRRVTDDDVEIYARGLAALFTEALADEPGAAGVAT